MKKITNVIIITMLALIVGITTVQATTSFNISGKPSSDDLNDSSINFENDVDYFIDGGKCKIGVASTVVQIIDGMPHILREGKIKENDILALL